MVNILKRLSKLNNVNIYETNDIKFKKYGKIIKGYDFSELIEYMDKETQIPKDGNVYYPSISKMEETFIYKKIKDNIYGEMDIQIGYCNGKNSTLNGLEYHKCSEINIAVTDMVLILGHRWDIENNRYDVKNVDAFYIRKGEAIELYETTLHLSPCKVLDEGFKAIVVLLRGTNENLENDIKNVEPIDELLLMRNKWIIAHPKRKHLLDKGAFPGIIGKNLEIIYK